MNEEKITFKTIVLSIVLIIFGFAIGFFFAKPIVQIDNNFYDGSIPNNITFDVGNNINDMYKHNIELSVCSGYIDPYYNCQQNLKFQNITGLYCNGTLVCSNIIGVQK